MGHDVDIVAPRLNGQKEGTFVYITIRDRWPKILSKAIDHVHRQRRSFIEKHGEAVDADVKAVIHEFSEMRYKITTNKPLDRIVDDSLGDSDYWNRRIEEYEKVLGADKATYYRIDWLFGECYMYRRIAGAFLRSKYLRHFDVFAEQKQESLSHHEEPVKQMIHHLWTCSNDVALEPRHVAETTECLMKMCLWGNRVDLSLSGGDHHHSGPVSPVFVANSCNEFILRDDTKDAIKYLTGLKETRIDFVLDNAGLELTTDLVFAEWLMKLKIADKIVFHGKSIPWFVSDVTKEDMNWTLQGLLSLDITARTLTHKWKLRFSTGEYEFRAHPFWTSASPFSRLLEEAPDLHKDLSQSAFIVFKGDLNYRKLVGDRSWPYNTPFEESLEGLVLPPLLALRTLKSETVSGLSNDAIRLMKDKFGESLEWMCTGEYAVVEFLQRNS